MDKKYLTIKEYADIRGVSVSSVYKRLNTTLKKYFVEVEGQKRLKIEVLEAEGLKPSNGEVEEVFNPNFQPSSTIAEKQLEIKDKQIEQLNEQIERLQEDNRKKDEFIQEQSRKLTELLEQSNILLQNNQLLLANNKTTEEDITASTVEEENIIAVPDEAEPIEPEQPQKKSWFSKLFG